MNKSILALICLALATAAFGQGKVRFQNDASRLIDWTPDTALLLPPEQPFAGQPIDQSSGHIPSGPMLIAGLYGGTSSASLSLLIVSQFGVLSPGLITPVNLILPFPGNTLTWFQVKIWDSAYATYEAAEAGFSYLGTSPEFSMTTGTGLTYPGINDAGGTTWPAGPIYVGLVPEPSVAALLALGGVFLLGRKDDSYKPRMDTERQNRSRRN
jgi:hypothetical protein